ncbi:MAG TPA: hypothetical protein VLD63_14450 [Anaerolineales bacterium]|nr:hypothetical protein [Anaerolineales bacterium]
MNVQATSKRPNGGRASLKTLITVGALAATALGWLLFGKPDSAEGSSTAPTEATLPPGWAELLAPLPTLVPPGVAMVGPSAPATQPALRRVSLPAPAPKPVTITRSSRRK